MKVSFEKVFEDVFLGLGYLEIVSDIRQVSVKAYIHSDLYSS